MTTYRAINCRWSPDIDPNSVGPCEDPDHPSRKTQRRHRLLLDMMLHGDDLTDVCKIVAAYPYLRSEYAPKLKERAAEIRGRATLERLRADRHPGHATHLIGCTLTLSPDGKTCMR
jgi:hypothetical protein